jgi:hypothetical protein
MCPACISDVALIAGTVSGGLTALLVRLCAMFRAKKSALAIQCKELRTSVSRSRNHA